MRAAQRNFLLRCLKVIGWFIASVTLLLIAIMVLVRIPAVQLKLTQKAVSYLEEKIGTRVALEGIYINFPKSITLEGIYLEDQKRDTLLYAGEASINTDLWALTRNEIQLNDISLKSAVAFIDRPEHDSAFNFTYILDAFAGDSTAVPDTLEEKGWDFSVGKIDLERVRVHYDDRLAGNLVHLSVGRFSLTMDEFDLAHNIIRAGDIELADTRLNVVQSQIPEVQQPVQEQKTDSAAALLLSLERLSLRNVTAGYEQSALQQSIGLEVGEFIMTADNIDLPNRRIDLDGIQLTDTNISFKRGQTVADTSPSVSGADTTQEPPWNVRLNSLTLENNALRYDDATTTPVTGSVDFNHLAVSAFNINVSNVQYAAGEMKATVRALSFREHAGFSVRNLTADIELGNTRAGIHDLVLVTGNSEIKFDGNISYPSIAGLGSALATVSLEAALRDTRIGTQDILYFQPHLADSLPIRLSRDMTLGIDARVHGRVDDLSIDHVRLATLDSTVLQFAGTVKGLPDPARLTMDLALRNLHTTASDLQVILPDTLLPDSINLPAWADVSGTYRGTADKGSFGVALASDAGGMELNGTMNLDTLSALRGFRASLAIDNLDVGGILQKPDTVMGPVSLQAKIDASGLSLDEMTATFTGTVAQFEYQRYRYTDLRLDGTLRRGLLSLAAGMDDRNLNFTLAGEYDLGAEVPKYHLSLDVKNVDLKALHLSSSPIRGRGMLLVNLATRDFRVMNGNVGIRKVAVFNGDKLYAIDSLLFASIDQEGRSEITIDSDLLTAQFEGSINIFALPDVLTRYVDTYYHLGDSLQTGDAPPQHFRFEVKLKNTELLTGLLVPQLTAFKPGDIRGEFDSGKRRLELKMDVNEVQYGSVGVKSLVFSTNSDSTSLRYNLMVDRIMVDSMRIDGLEFNGTVAEDSLRTDLIVLDSADEKKYVFAGTLFSRDDALGIRLLPRATLLNYQRWILPSNNYIEVGANGFIAQNVTFTHGGEKLIIDSGGSAGSPVHIGFRKLNLEYLSSVIAAEKPLTGLLQGDINILPDSAGMAFTSNLTIDDLRFSRVPWGDVSLKVDQQLGNRYDVNFALLGNGNDIRAGGSYTSGESPRFDLAAAINRFDLQSLQPVLESQLSDLSGAVSGKISVKGTPDKPDIDGSIAFANTHFLSTYLNSAFTIADERIAFVDEGISFDKFDVTDDRGNRARLDGTILTRTYRDFRFNLDLSSDNFRLLNTTEKDNDLFYGRVDIALNAKIRGTLGTPEVVMEIALRDGSNLTYIVPQSQASVLQTEGIVRFVDKTFQTDPFMKQIKEEAADTVKSDFTGIDLTARLALTDEQTLTVVIDPLTGDQLTVKGNSTLTLQIDPTGDIHLTGRYEISEGTYNLTFYKFIKREFSIEKGSTITWLGDPMNAEMNIRAIYSVETSPIELFSNQLSGAASAETNQYKQRLPFQVYLNLTDELLQPEIKFELQMPMASRNAMGGTVYARLQDINTRESDLNKQVFALLILKRFIAEDPFQNQGPGGLESTARNSVSKILSEQLNRLSQNIKGVELSFDIKSYEDYSSGQAQGQTELQLGVSKSLFNDRLVVKLSGNVDVEGQRSQREATDYIGDLALEYKITPDGRLRITGFRNSDYDMIDGELTETGTGLIYVKDYDALSELFKANANPQLRN